MAAAHAELERLTRVTPFAFRLWDGVERRAVADGLQVVARSASGRERPVKAGPSGLFAIRDLSLAMPFVSGSGNADFWKQPPPLDAAWTIEVDDPLGRFLPFRFTADGALRITNDQSDACSIPDGGGAAQPGAAVQPGLPTLPLYSAPTRSAPPGVAVIRMDLETTSHASAGATVVEVRMTGTGATVAMADGSGHLVAFVRYPAPERRSGILGGPPRRPLAQETWRTVLLRAFWDADLERRDCPDACAIREMQAKPEVPILARQQPRTQLQELTLEYGRPLVVRTADRAVAVLDTGSPPGP